MAKKGAKSKAGSAKKKPETKAKVKKKK